MPGTLDNYRVLRTLGSGASCKVKLGEEIESGKKVAIKIMSPDMDLDTQNLVLTELNALQKLNHQNVLKILYSGKGEYKKTNNKVK